MKGKLRRAPQLTQSVRLSHQLRSPEELASRRPPGDLPATVFRYNLIRCPVALNAAETANTESTMIGGWLVAGWARQVSPRFARPGRSQLPEIHSYHPF